MGINVYFYQSMVRVLSLEYGGNFYLKISHEFCSQ